MIRSFVEHLQDNKKLYEFNIRLAFIPSSDDLKRIEAALNAYQLESISKPKSLPIQEDSINFPRLGPVELTILEVALAYPVIPLALARLLYERAGIPESHMAVYTKAQEEFKIPNADYEKKPALLDTAPADADPDAKKVYGNEFVSEFLDSIETRDYEIAGDNVDKAETTNDLEQGTTSPLSNQNKLPTAEDL